jgi:hypothetical protein
MLYKCPSCKCFKSIKNLASKLLEEWEREEEE